MILTGHRYFFGNVLTVGMTQMGKTYGVITEDILPAALNGEVSIVAIDPHAKSLAWKSFVQLVAHGLEHRIIFDRLSSFERAPQYNLLEGSTSDSPLLRLSENEQAACSFADVLTRRREMRSLATAPQTEEYVMKAAMLLLNQREQRPASDLRFALEPQHRVFRELLENCLHTDTAFQFAKVRDGSIRPGTYAAAKRLIDAVCGSAPFIARSGTSFDLGRFLDRRGILLIEGSTEKISADAAQTIMGAIILKVIQYARLRGRSTPRVLLVLDEATTANLIGASGYEAKAMAELQKAGLDFSVIVQQCDFPTAAITSAVLNNTAIHRYFHLGSESAISMAAADLGDTSYREHIRDLQRGECLIKNRGKVLPYRVPAMRDPYGFPGMAEAYAEEALERIRTTRPEYEEPQCNELVPTGESHDRESETAHNSISVPPSTSSISSPASRLQAEGSGECDSEGSSPASDNSS